MYTGNLALQTGRELLSIGLDTEKNLHEVSSYHIQRIDGMNLAVESLATRPLPTQHLPNCFDWQVSLPFLVLHGTDDVVADPSGSKLLHERASSRDKTLKLYPGMWHVLMGERPEDVERVFADVISWLEDRVGDAASFPGARRHDEVLMN